MDYFATVTHEFWVRPGDLDGLGHVNHARVLEYLEAARWHWLDAHDIPREGRVASVVSRAEVDYVREIVYEPVRVATTLSPPEAGDLDDWLDGRLTYKAAMRQEILRIADGRRLARALVYFGFIDRESRRLSVLRDFLSQRHGRALHAKGEVFA